MKTLLFFVILMLSTVTNAFQVEPMVQKLEAIGVKSQTEYRVENASEETLAVEAVVMARTIANGSEEQLVAADRDFLVMPPQATIQPGQFQSFRVRYLGSQENKQAVSYRIIFKQLPLKTEKEQSGVDLLFNFSTLVFVSPPNSKPKLSTEINDNLITIVNRGNGVADLNGALITLITNSGKIELPWSDFGSQSAVNFLVPNQVTSFPVQSSWVNGKVITGINVKL
ncbi:fimbria/pilus periplasmic chaperone [Vibrio alginolyticus]|nr:fimbria/pilus periplasmic chaperone [Vibrio alginolyticus]